MHFLDSQVLSRFTANESSRDIHVTTLTEKALRSPGRFGIQKSAVEKEFTFTWSAERKRALAEVALPARVPDEPHDGLEGRYPTAIPVHAAVPRQSSPFYKSLIESQKARLFNPLQG